MSNKINILIVEDELMIAEDMALRLIEMGYGITATVSNVQAAIEELELKKVDLLLIDICLEGGQDGIELARIINDRYQLPFIFITSMANNQVLERAKEVAPRSFLLKPFNDRQVKISIEMALVKQAKPHSLPNHSHKKLSHQKDSPLIRIEESLFLKRDNRFERIYFKNILWLEAEGNYTCVHTISDKLIYSNVLKKFEAKLPSKQFIRVHRSYIVNIANITGFEGNRLQFGNHNVPVSKPYQSRIFQMFQVI